MPAPVRVVPLPADIQTGDGSFTLTPDTRILTDPSDDARRVAALLADALRPATGYALPVQDRSADVAAPAIVISTEGADAALGNEGYTLHVSREGVRISAPKAAGLFYGAQTLRQLLPPAIASETRQEAEWSIPGVAIRDTPRFPMRGFMLDSCRHIQSVDFIKRTLDLLALYKINTFHWHLTEDQGWRLEIKKYPKLTEVGAWRGEGKERYGGFYSQDQIREIVRYAAERFITVVPEVDMPGHMLGALAAYPHLGCTGGPYKVRTKWGIEDDVMCAGRETTFEFVEDVLTEVMDLFPSKVIHIGGDESPRVRWKECPDCQERIRAEGLADEAALQNYFTRRVGAFLTEHGRRLMGWNEIMDGGDLPEDVIVHAWIGENTVARAAKAGYEVLDSMHQWYYFDYSYEKTSMAKTYEHDPLPEGLAPEEAGRVLGAQANLWTEYRPTEAAADEYTWPRLLAVAEMGWTPQGRRDWDAFRARLLEDQCERLAHAGLGDPKTPHSGLAEALKARVDIAAVDSAPLPWE